MQTVNTSQVDDPEARHRYGAAALKVAVASDNTHASEARALASELSLPFFEQGSNTPVSDAHYVLHLDTNGLTLLNLGGSSGAIECDFMGGRLRHRHRFGGGFGQAIARAVGIKASFMPVVADLTAGLGADAFVLAGLGATVTLVERNPVVAALLKSGLDRALRYGDDEDLLSAINRMKLVVGDARDWLADLDDAHLSTSEDIGVETSCPDVIYLDPMFPERNKSAQVKKEMQVLQALVDQNDDLGDLLDAAQAKARYRVVVKRPRLAEHLDKRQPSFSVTGKSTRFDVYVLAKLPSKK